MATLLVALSCTWIGRRANRLTFDHAVTAVSLGAPLLILFLVDLDGLGVTRHRQIDPELNFDPPGLFLTGVPVALALVALVRHQNRGRSAPRPSWAGSGTDQSVARFFTFVTIALVAPWVSIALWAPSQMAREDVGGGQTSLA